MGLKIFLEQQRKAAEASRKASKFWKDSSFAWGRAVPQTPSYTGRVSSTVVLEKPGR